MKSNTSKALNRPQRPSVLGVTVQFDGKTQRTVTNRDPRSFGVQSVQIIPKPVSTPTTRQFGPGEQSCKETL
ncbi:hypothetical protein RvY_05770 [Ramazzottius varieornatus]|uniref:Uncharacterized protein n=1 Tax=Ramazzottius varieornatus TaxID=947166 RepID=A0A1D1V2U0_RAMVA|nr:hypothetical protein RvY_05770 [Ramazzottius varieornatus]